MEQSAKVPHADLIEQIEAYCQATGIAQTKFGEMAVNDPNLMRDLRNGRELRRKTMARILSTIQGSTK